MTNKYKRSNTNTTISLFYEQHCLKKYNYSPPYQRDYNVWNAFQKSFLIDSIFKNFPIPPVFLEQKIVDGKTYFDVIDGKQRLNAIIDFINNKVKLPEDFGNDAYGNPKINGKTFKEIKELSLHDSDLQEYLDTFWGYIINVEYIEKPDEKVVDSIFDRLNRGGERLNPAELRKAKYYDTLMYQGICEVSKNQKLTAIISHLDKIRLENISFITEIYLLILTGKIIGGVEKEIDTVFELWVSKVNSDLNDEIINTITLTIDAFVQFDLDLREYKILGTSHLYALFYFSLYLVRHKIPVTSEISTRINSFYFDLRNKSADENVKYYSESMQSASKYKSSRKKRIKALLNYLGFSSIDVKDPSQTKKS